MAGSKPDDYIDVTRYLRLNPRKNSYGRIIDVDLGQPVKTEPNWSDGPFVKVTFKVHRNVFKPLADITVTLDENNVASPDVIVADLQELRDSLQ